ncbi:MAG: glycoside hydrolase N-terminal domain-containing protein [Bacteroidales bacterium]|nr:glycoside hydrolase N-terminal domain-containing protein [Bacteroidales bacterium]
MRTSILRYLLILGVISLTACNQSDNVVSDSSHNLKYSQLAVTWDEAIPLGNGELGALIWNKDGKLRFSLDRSDLWDLRPISWLEKDEFRFSWVYEKWLAGDYKIVQDFFDKGAYENSIAPSKIPGAGLEINFQGVDQVEHVELDVASAVAYIRWANGATMESFVQADQTVGWFKIDHLPDGIKLELIPPKYESDPNSEKANSVTGQDLQRLGYHQGDIVTSDNSLHYHQVGWGGFYYDVAVKWKIKGRQLLGNWSISSSISEEQGKATAQDIVGDFSYRDALRHHSLWWKEFWGKSSVALPDSVLEKQWYLEQYKFGSAARANTPPISLQAVWTADNGRMPPWKGDFHHDLNTQLSYWSSYSGNHLDLEIGFLNWLWQNKPVAEAYTRRYFEVGGLNFPGVSTLKGKAMGGWIQYSCGATVGAWLGQHFYLHWRYSMDREFLKNRAYPWISEVATFLDNFSVKDEKSGLRKLPLSSSPEIHDNSADAWFQQTTNFDLGLIRFTFAKAAELAKELGYDSEAASWEAKLKEWPQLAYDESGLNFAPGQPYEESHRHFSHLMAWHPLGIMDVANGDDEKEVIDHTLRNLEKYGPGLWTGYSYSWLGNLYARAFEGDNAAQALRDFATCFCLPNSFHVNGDQSKSGKSRFQYRPFTLEGNFAFASGIQEMLLQSHTGIVRVFPAIPGSWKDVSFEGLRAEGAFVISAQLIDGEVDHVSVEATVDGVLQIAIGPYGEALKRNMKKGEKIVLYLSDFSLSGMVK